MKILKEKRAFRLSEFRAELEVNIVSFWKSKMIDEANGGFHGRMDGANQIISDAPKGLVLNARILWTFSAAYGLTDRKDDRDTAMRAYQYLKNHFVDEVHGGMYWMVDSMGRPLETKKQIYAQAFAIYALAEYYKISSDPSVLDLAMSLFQCIETQSFDQDRNGYFEAYDREWNLLDDLRLSDKDANEAKTMNTHLHILEAYTTLYEVSKDIQVGDKLTNLITLFFDKFLRSIHQFHLFFDEDWNLKSEEISYGHDIEAAWLIHTAALVLNDPVLIQKSGKEAVHVALATLPHFDDDGGLWYAGNDQGTYDREKHWWPQAEALVGLMNAYQISGDEKFLYQAQRCWEFINDHLIDQANGEWIWGVDKNGMPMEGEDKAGPWKCPYHNGRAMLEMIRRCEARQS